MKLTNKEKIKIHNLELKSKEANEKLEILLNALLTGELDNKEEASELIFNLLEEFRNEIKQRVKSACEFYLRYKDNMNLLLKEQDKEGELLKQIRELDSKQTWENYHEWTIRMISSYHEWLFKLAFKDVFKNSRNVG